MCCKYLANFSLINYLYLTLKKSQEMNCRCDEQLAHSLKNLAPTVYDDDFQDFDHVSECKASSSTGSGASNDGGSGSGNNVECCGTYPNRFEFLTQE